MSANETDRVFGKSVNQLFGSKPVRDILRANNLVYVVSPVDSPTNINFKPGRVSGLTKEDQPMGVPLFGMDNCRGVVIASDPVDAANRMEMLSTNHSESSDIAVVTEGDLPKWTSFYKLLSDYENLSNVVRLDVLAGMSGLERATPDEVADMLRSFHELFFRNYRISDGVQLAGKDTLPGVDIVFVDEDNQPVTLDIWHNRNATQENGFLVSEIAHGPINTVGMVAVRPGESRLEMEERALKLENELGVKLGRVTDGGLRVFSKLGFNELKTGIPGTGVDLRAVVDLLFLGKSNLEPGILAREPYGLSLPEVASERLGVDLLFTKRNGGGTLKRTYVDGVTGLDLRALKKGSVAFSPVGNVGGIMVFPNDMSVEEMHERAKTAHHMANRPYPGPDTYFLFLTPSLLERWHADGTPIFSGSLMGKDVAIRADEGEGALPEEASIGRRVEYALGVGKVEKYGVRLGYRGPKIGDAQLTLEEHGPEYIARYSLDTGSVYAAVPEEEKGLTGRAGTAIGLRQGFQNGEHQMLPGLFAWPYLVRSAFDWPALLDPTNTEAAVVYARSELFFRSERDDLANVIGAEAADKIIDLGFRDVRSFGIKRGRLAANAVSHGHNDHVGGLAVQGGESSNESIRAPIIGDWRTMAHLQSITNRAPDWMSRHLLSTRIDQPKDGSAYEFSYRETRPVYYYGQEYRLSPQTSMVFYPADHSIEASMIGVFSPYGKILYTGDFQMGSETNDGIEMIAREGYDVFIVDATNPKETSKASAHVTIDQVRDNLTRVARNDSKAAMVVMAPPNHLDRLSLINDVADLTGRKLVLGYHHADVVTHMAAAKQYAPLDAYGRGIWTPTIGQDTGLFVKPMAAPRPWQTALETFAGSKEIGVVNQQRLQENPGEFLLTLSPYDSISKNIGGASLKDRLSVVYSAPFPYQSRDKHRLAAIQAQTNRQGGKFYADFDIHGDGGRVNYSDDSSNGFHNGGHASFEERMEALVRMVPKNKPVTVYMIHTQHPESAARDAAEYFSAKGIRNVAFEGRYDHYNKDNPFQQSGHFIDMKTPKGRSMVTKN